MTQRCPADACVPNLMTIQMHTYILWQFLQIFKTEEAQKMKNLKEWQVLYSLAGPDPFRAGGPALQGSGIVLE